MIYKTIDLCAGIGGIRRGFELAGGFENVCSAEIDEQACRTYEGLFGEDPKNDITSEEFKDEIVNLNYDVLMAGFPCQAFSAVGERKGFRDTTKGTIFFELADIIHRTHPKIIFLENVENLVRHDKGSTFRTIIRTLEKELDYKVIGVSEDLFGEPDYDVHTFIRNSKYFGLPQNRPRVYIAAFSKKYYGESLSLLPSQLPERRAGAPIYEDVCDLLEKGDVPAKYFLSEGLLATLEKHKTRQRSKGSGFGMKIVNDPSEKQHISCTLLATGGSGRERNLIIDEKNGRKYAGTMVGEKKSPINRKYIRTMIPAEWGRLQGFIGYAFVDADGIDHFSFPKDLPDLQKYKQFGNSVTIPVIETFAETIYICSERMRHELTEVPRRLFLLHGTDFLMCYKLYNALRGRVRDKTFLNWVNAYTSIGVNRVFGPEILSILLDSSYPRAIQVLNQLIDVGFARKISRGKYVFTSEYMGEDEAGVERK